VIRCKSSCTLLKQSLHFTLACIIHLSISPLSVRGLAACCIACHHFAISLSPTPHNIGPACQAITFCHRITFHRSRGLPFSHRSCSWKNIYFYGTRPLLFSLTISPEYSRPLYHRVSEGRGDLPFPLVSIYNPVISTQLSVGVP